MKEYRPFGTEDNVEEGEQRGLLEDEAANGLPMPTSRAPVKTQKIATSSFKLGLSFGAGVVFCAFAQYLFPALCMGGVSPTRGTTAAAAQALAGDRVTHVYPPPSPTNKFPSYFPTDIGYAGPTPTGAEAAVIATAPGYPIHTGAPNLLGPSKSVLSGAINETFDIFRYWGNLSPWYSVSSKTFGLDTTPDAPEGCTITGLHLLHRHGARYPTPRASYAGPYSIPEKLQKALKDGVKWKANGPLSFLNDWTYKLGGDILTPFGRQQLFDLGVSMRIKYGYLLQNFTEQHALPVFRTESQDRMLYSAHNFAIGFFGFPHHDQYLQSITIEAPLFNNTLSPYMTCPNAFVPSKADRGIFYVKEWTSKYLADAHKRLNSYLDGINFTIEDLYASQQLCAYETVALGYSQFCELFTQEEWEGFEYAMDLYFWYTSAFGSPVARIQGVGWITELVSRLTGERIQTHNTSTNKTLDDNDVTFPFGKSLYVDATHEVVFLNILTALNLTNLAASGPLPSDHIPDDLKFGASQLSPFATNMQVQLLSCPALPDPQIRLVVNDGVTPLTSIKGCPSSPTGLCPLPTFVSAQKELLAEADWEWECWGDWEVPEGRKWNTTSGSPSTKRRDGWRMPEESGEERRRMEKRSAEFAEMWGQPGAM